MKRYQLEWVGPLTPEDEPFVAFCEEMYRRDALRWEVHQWTGNDPDYCARCLVEWEDADYTCEAPK